MIRVKEAIVVEGKYDKIKLSSLVEGVIIETKGFGIFQDREKLAYLRALAKKRGLIVLTDSDGAGFLIRGKLSSSIPPEQIKHAYIPDILGKERRKAAPSKEGKLGVEGFSAADLYEIFRKAGVLDGVSPPAPADPITKADLFSLGLSGGERSGYKRAALLKKMGLPERLTAKGLLPVLNTLLTREELAELVKSLDEEDAGCGR